MAETFSISGSWRTTPSAGAQGDITALADLFTTMVIKRKQVTELDLTSDPVVAVALGGSIHVLSVRTVGGRANIRITTAGGSTQVVPVDTLVVIVTDGYPITALDVQRETGVNVQVSLFFAEKA